MIYLAADLETVLDVELGMKVWPDLKVEGGYHKDVRAGMRQKRLEESGGKSDFLKPIFHQVVALGLAYHDTTTGVEGVTGWSGGYDDWSGGYDEQGMIEAFLAALRKRPTLITHNGRGFDLPVIRHRALKYRIDAHTLYGPAGAKNWDTYEYRYGGPHLDIGDFLSGYGACAMAKLDELLWVCGEEPKTGHGSEVEEMCDEADWVQLNDYVKADALKTLHVGLRLEESRGRVHPPPEQEQLTLEGSLGEA